MNEWCTSLILSTASRSSDQSSQRSWNVQHAVPIRALDWIELNRMKIVISWGQMEWIFMIWWYLCWSVPHIFNDSFHLSILHWLWRICHSAGQHSVCHIALPSWPFWKQWCVLLDDWIFDVRCRCLSPTCMKKYQPWWLSDVDDTPSTIDQGWQSAFCSIPSFLHFDIHVFTPPNIELDAS